MDEVIRDKQSSNEIYQALIENTGTMLAFVDVEFNFVMVNSEFARGIGHDKAELIGRNLLEVFPSEGRREALEVIRDSGEALVVKAHAFKFSNQPERDVTYWDCLLTPSKDTAGQVTGIVFSMVEVTEQVRVKLELEEARRLAEAKAAELDTVFNSMQDMVFIYDEESRIQKVNPAAVSIVGFNPTGTCLQDRIKLVRLENSAGELLALENLPTTRALKGETVRNEFYNFTNTHGEKRALLCTAVPLIMDGCITGAVTTWHDIDAQEKVKHEREEARQQAETRATELDAVFDAMKDMVFIYNSEGRTQKVNSVVISVLGYDPTGSFPFQEPDQVRITTFAGVKPTIEQLPTVRALKGVTVQNEYYRFVNTQDQERLFVCTAVPLISQNTIIGAVTSWHDVTEQNKLWAQLEDERARLVTILEQMPVGVTIVEAPSGEVISRNNKMLEIWRGNKSESNLEEIIYVQPNYYLDGKQYRNDDMPIYRSLCHGEVIAGEEMMIKRFDGTEGIIRVYTSPIRDRNGEIVAGVIISHDITEEKMIEERLRFANLLQQIIEVLPDATFVLNNERKVIAWNRAAEKMSGTGKEDVLGTDRYSQAFFDERRPMLADYLLDGKEINPRYHSVTRENDTVFAEIHVPSGNDGRGAFIELKVTLIKNKQGETIGVIQSERDITRQREMEAENLKLQKIESIGLMAGGIAHDFNNLLAGILASAQLARFKMDEGEANISSMLRLEKIILDGTNLTRQLLAFAKGGAPVKKVISVEEIIRETGEFALQGSKSKCRCILSDDLCLIEADAGQIAQVISNIVINADQAMPDGGVVEIRADNVEINPADLIPLKTGRYVKISLSDQGIGIPPENIERIFDPYFTTKSKGHGLGLATSYLIVSNHDGLLQVESELGKGTTFHLYFPVVETEMLKENVKTKNILPGKGRILFMDDEEIIRSATGEMLQRIGYEVAYAEGGNEAIQLYFDAKDAGHPFDVLIMDLTVPGGVGGKEALRRILAVDPGAKAIVSSGYSNDPVMADFAHHGFRGVLEKPYKIEDLSEVLNQAMKEG